MPTPLGHALSGLILARVATPHAARTPWPLMAGAVLVSLAPDGDNLPHKLYGIDVWHREWTHALAVAPAAGLACFLLALAFCRSHLARAFLVGTLAWAVHVLLDCLSSLTGPKLLLPWSDVRFTSSVHFLPVVEPHIGSVFFNTVGVFSELAIFGLPCVYLYGRSRSSSHRAARQHPLRLGLWALWLFLLFGSWRQGEFRMEFFGMDGTRDASLVWYEKNLDSLTPLHFGLFIEPLPPTPPF